MNSQRQISRHAKAIVVAMLSIVALVSFQGCAYSRWDYVPIEEPIHTPVTDKSWSIDCGFWDVGAGRPVSEGYIRRDSAHYYYVSLEETDTTRNSRFAFGVKDVRLTLSDSDEPVLLTKRSERSRAGEHDGATNVNHTIWFSAFRVPVPRPDTILVEQDITAYYRDTGEVVTSFHYLTKAYLKRFRYWYILEFMAGT